MKALVRTMHKMLHIHTKIHTHSTYVWVCMYVCIWYVNVHVCTCHVSIKMATYWYPSTAYNASTTYFCSDAQDCMARNTLNRTLVSCCDSLCIGVTQFFSRNDSMLWKFCTQFSLKVDGHDLQLVHPGAIWKLCRTSDGGLGKFRELVSEKQKAAILEKCRACRVQVCSFA